MEFSSKLLESAVHEMAQLPGIGKRTALRLVLHLLKRPEEQTRHLAGALQRFREEIKLCSNCHNISDVELCEICSNSRRDRETICVVEDIRDVMAIENTAQFKALYHVLEKVSAGEVKEVVLALSSTMEGDTTNFYIYRQLQKFEVKITTIARGISIGDEIEYADEVTLGRSILNRVPFENSLK